MRKTFNIGESCYGGTIIVEQKNLTNHIKVCRYKTKIPIITFRSHVVDKHKMAEFLESDQGAGC